ncbi:MAG: hypothetical protein ACN6PE_17600 [Achromobacter marplatensis]|uniref:hypothetical protein n=1 Tax=Achromobacter marplatensis TaxID=470868 RepID=UPI003D03C73E
MAKRAIAPDQQSIEMPSRKKINRQQKSQPIKVGLFALHPATHLAMRFAVRLDDNFGLLDIGPALSLKGLWWVVQVSNL